jgi:hypothetical protein
MSGIILGTMRERSILPISEEITGPLLVGRQRFAPLNDAESSILMLSASFLYAF